MVDYRIVLPKLYEVLNQEIMLDLCDWQIVCHYSDKWKLSIADGLLDLNYLDEVQLAKVLAKANNLPYVPGHFLKFDYFKITIDNFDDLLSVGAIPLEDSRLAICNPYDDHRGFLGNSFCDREMVVTERSAIMTALRQQGLNQWIHHESSLEAPGP